MGGSQDNDQSKERAAYWRELVAQQSEARRAGDLRALEQAYDQQALFLWTIGEPHQKIARLVRKARRCYLRAMRRLGGFKTVCVLTVRDERDCDYCQRIDGQEFSITWALLTMPLPGPARRCDRNQGMCRSTYVPGRFNPGWKA